MKKLVIFDLDGTLVDSIYDLADCVNTALEHAGLPLNSLEEYYSFVGNGMEHLVRSAMKSFGSDDELYASVRQDFDAEYKLHCTDKTCAYDGVAEVLSALDLHSVATAVLSNKAECFISAILKKSFPSHRFAAAWGQREGIERKPSGMGLTMMISELGYSKEDCIYVGDSEVDVYTSNAAEIDCVCVNWGFRSEAELVSAGAKNIVSSADELLKFLMRNKNG